jgi:hypothetical protein
MDAQSSALSFVAGLLTGLLAGWFSHRLAARRDRRKEFNDASQADFVKLTRQLQDLRGGWLRTERIDSTLYEHMFVPWRRSRFKSDVAAYVDAQKAAFRQDEAGAVSLDPAHAPHIEAAIVRLLKDLRRR